jgi:short-subunit dehydrogenase
MRQVRGRVAVVTGGASGIGRATALSLAREGCSLALVDIDAGRLETVGAEGEALGVAVSQHVVDVSDAERMRALADEIEGQHGAVHILVNNAGVSVLKSFEEHTLDDFQWLVGINFWGVVHGCKFFLPALRRAEEAHIVNISSMFGFIGVPGQSSYCATKFAVRGFTESLWAELRDTRIGVTSIHPGGIATGIVRSVRARDEAAKGQLQESFDRYGHPAEHVAEAILKAIRRGKLRAIVGIEAHFVDWLKRLMPVGFHKLFAARIRVPGS